MFEAFDFSIHDLHWFFYKVKFSVNLDLLERNKKVLIIETLLEVTHVEGAVNFVELLR